MKVKLLFMKHVFRMSFYDHVNWKACDEPFFRVVYKHFIKVILQCFHHTTYFHIRNWYGIKDPILVFNLHFSDRTSKMIIY